MARRQGRQSETTGQGQIAEALTYLAPSGRRIALQVKPQQTDTIAQGAPAKENRTVTQRRALHLSRLEWVKSTSARISVENLLFSSEKRRFLDWMTFATCFREGTPSTSPEPSSPVRPDPARRSVGLRRRHERST